jgi:3-methyladenine DNA glycosylase/8-oxoguanine DNA glycosylase
MSKKVIGFLTRKDPVLGRFIKKCEPVSLTPNNRITLFEALVKSVVGQQLSGKAAHSILTKLKDQVGGKKPISPEKILGTPFGEIRGAGVSESKARTIVALAKMTKEGAIPSARKMKGMSDEEIIEVLTSVKGIGRWTVEMILMFKLGRQDVMPATDLGVRKGYSIIFGHRDLATPKAILEHSQKWSPYRSFVAMYCWAAADG